MRKYKYLIQRIVHIKFKTIFDKINIVHEQNGKDKLFIFVIKR